MLNKLICKTARLCLFLLILIVSFQIGNAHISLDTNNEDGGNWRYFIGGGFGSASLLYTEPLPSIIIESGFSKQYSKFLSGEYSIRASTRSYTKEQVIVDWTDTLVSRERNNNIIVDIGYTFMIGVNLSSELHLFTGTGIGFFFNVYSRRNYGIEFNRMLVEEGSENTMDFDIHDPFYFGITMKHNIGIRWDKLQFELMIVQPRFLNLTPSNDGYSLGAVTIKYFLQ